MASPPKPVLLPVHVLGHTVSTGHWCRACALPSVAEVRVEVADGQGVQTSTSSACSTCPATPMQ